MRKIKISWIATTAAFIALLIGAQVVTAGFSQFVTGSLVNLILIISVMTCGLSSGLTVAVLSPIFAEFFGIGPLWMVLPFVFLGNAVLILVWHTLGRMKYAKKQIVLSVTLITAAVCKFLTLYVGIVRIAIPLFLNLNEKQAEVMSFMFSFPQLITALIGGAIAFAVLPAIEKARAAK